ncbi:MAG: RpiB/LacA/LacB family sugar-phosphate isomerase, partial [Chitinophagaceae bacterium]
MENTFNLKKPIAVGADHAGYAFKSIIVEQLRGKGLQVKDFGTNSAEPVDYPDFAHPVAEAVEKEQCGCGILVCGSANGVAIAANKHYGIRAAISWETDIA